jgi:hypothetical protein
MYSWTVGHLDRWTDGQMDRWTDGQMDRWTDGQMDRRTMEHHVFSFGLIIEGTTEKVLQFKIPLKSICNQTLGLIGQEMYFEKPKRG